MRSSMIPGAAHCVAMVAAMRNLAGRRFSATSRYHDNAPRIAGSFQIVSLPRSLMGRLLGSIYTPTALASMSGAQYRWPLRARPFTSFASAGRSTPPAMPPPSAEQRDELAPFQVIDWHQVPGQPSAGYRISRVQSAGRLRRAALEPDKLGEWRIWPTTAARQLLDQARNRSVWMTVYLSLLGTRSQRLERVGGQLSLVASKQIFFSGLNLPPKGFALPAGVAGHRHGAPPCPNFDGNLALIVAQTGGANASNGPMGKSG